MIRRQKPATRLLHYVVPDVRIGGATRDVWAFRCAECKTDIHVDQVPAYCPACGRRFTALATTEEPVQPAKPQSAPMTDEEGQRLLEARRAELKRLQGSQAPGRPPLPFEHDRIARKLKEGDF